MVARKKENPVQTDGQKFTTLTDKKVEADRKKAMKRNPALTLRKNRPSDTKVPTTGSMPSQRIRTRNQKRPN